MVWEKTYPEPDDYGPESWQAEHNDAEAEEMNRLRGLVMVQAAETEAVLGRVLHCLDPAANPQRPAGVLLKNIETLLGQGKDAWAPTLSVVSQAIQRRNRVVHDRAEVGSVWRDYATGGGEWVSVISFLGDEEYGEPELIEDLALQQDATEAAVRLLHAVEETQRPLDGS